MCTWEHRQVLTGYLVRFPLIPLQPLSKFICTTIQTFRQNKSESLQEFIFNYYKGCCHVNFRYFWYLPMLLTSATLLEVKYFLINFHFIIFVINNSRNGVVTISYFLLRIIWQFLVNSASSVQFLGIFTNDNHLKMTIDYVGFAYAVTVAAGGIIGYVKAGTSRICRSYFYKSFHTLIFDGAAPYFR